MLHEILLSIGTRGEHVWDPARFRPAESDHSEADTLASITVPIRRG